MIVSSMNEDELMREVNADLVNAFRYSDTKDKKFRRMVLKSSKFPVCAYSEYLSPQKNRWMILYEARNKKMVGDDCLITFVVTYESSIGTFAVMNTSTNGSRHLVVFSPHFFQRYASRTGKTLTGRELMRAYFTDNASFAYTRYGDGGLCGSTKEGVAMGFVTEHNNMLIKTFITYDMTKGEQVETFAQCEQMRIEIHGR